MSFIVQNIFMKIYRAFQYNNPTLGPVIKDNLFSEREYMNIHSLILTTALLSTLGVGAESFIGHSPFALYIAHCTKLEYSGDFIMQYYKTM